MQEVPGECNILYVETIEIETKTADFNLEDWHRVDVVGENITLFARSEKALNKVLEGLKKLASDLWGTDGDILH